MAGSLCGLEWSSRYDQEKTAKKTAKKPATTVYQFKITLLDTKPKIRPPIRIPDCTLNTLRYHIQAVMGWENSHTDIMPEANALVSA